mmetsp:Transcript_9357/g.22186  ORF Transcript_9357/g.22186 Transcript_9357/m.22186 type:complete len:237 (+) Transcript_9357:851-1561(+)
MPYVPPMATSPPPAATASASGATLPRKSARAREIPAPMIPRPSRLRIVYDRDQRASSLRLPLVFSLSFSPPSPPPLERPVLQGFFFQKLFSNIDDKELRSFPAWLYGRGRVSSRTTMSWPSWPCSMCPPVRQFSSNTTSPGWKMRVWPEFSTISTCVRGTTNRGWLSSWLWLTPFPMPMVSPRPHPPSKEPGFDPPSRCRTVRDERGTGTVVDPATPHSQYGKTMGLDFVSVSPSP